jgi:hypothetical protein
MPLVILGIPFRRAEGREHETQIEDAVFKKVAREPNRFEMVFSSPTPQDHKDQSSLLWFPLVLGGAGELRTNHEQSMNGA